MNNISPKEEQSKQSSAEDSRPPHSCKSPCGCDDVDVATSLPDDNGLTKCNSKSKFMPSPIKYVFPKYLLRPKRTPSSQSKPSESKSPQLDVKDSNDVIGITEYDKLLDTTGMDTTASTCVAILANQFEPYIVDPYVCDLNQLEESSQPRPSKGILASYLEFSTLLRSFLFATFWPLLTSLIHFKSKYLITGSIHDVISCVMSSLVTTVREKCVIL